MREHGAASDHRPHDPADVVAGAVARTGLPHSGQRVSPGRPCRSYRHFKHRRCTPFFPSITSAADTSGPAMPRSRSGDAPRGGFGRDGVAVRVVGMRRIILPDGLARSLVENIPVQLEYAQPPKSPPERRPLWRAILVVSGVMASGVLGACIGSIVGIAAIFLFGYCTRSIPAGPNGIVTSIFLGICLLILVGGVGGGAVIGALLALRLGSAIARLKRVIDPERLRRRKRTAWLLGGLIGCLIVAAVTWGVYHRYYDMSNPENPNSPYFQVGYRPSVIYSDPGHNLH